MSEVAVILYGNGGSLGNFEIFARSLARTLKPRYGASRIVQAFVDRRDRFFEFLHQPPFRHQHKIGELHVFSHSIGAGLFLAYGDAATREIRENFIYAMRTQGRRGTYEEVVKCEVGTVLTDDLVRPPFDGMRDQIVSNFAEGAFIKLWGCNSGISNWIYGDDGNRGPSESEEPYYWRALNEKNVPKPSVAAAFAKYFGRTTYGATSGAHIEVLHKGKWLSSGRYRAAAGEWPSGSLVHRLSPDQGAYNAYAP